MPRTKSIRIVLAKFIPKSSGYSRTTRNPMALRSAKFPAAYCINSHQPGWHLHAPEKEGWREAMAGTISFYDAQGERQHTIYLGATPEYGKADFLRRFTAEIERVKVRFPDAKRVGLADGAESNWQFLTQHTEAPILDFYHASSYLGSVVNAKYP